MQIACRTGDTVEHRGSCSPILNRSDRRFAITVARNFFTQNVSEYGKYGKRCVFMHMHICTRHFPVRNRAWLEAFRSIHEQINNVEFPSYRRASNKYTVGSDERENLSSKC